MKLLQLTLLTLITSINSLQKTTNELWRMNGNVRGELYTRPNWAGNVTIEIEDEKILSIKGIIIPIHTTDWRPNDNCDPYNSCFVSGEPSCKGTTTIEDGYDRGHIMALSNGGPNIRENVIAQPSNWQGSGEWRKLEKEIQRVVLIEYGWDNTIYLNDVFNSNKPTNTVSWKINLIYGDNTCEPIEYNGIVETSTKKYEFKILNKGTYTFNEVTPSPTLSPTSSPTNEPTDDSDMNNALKYGLIFLTIGIVVSILMIGYCIYKKCVNQRILENQVNSIDLELGDA